MVWRKLRVVIALVLVVGLIFIAVKYRAMRGDAELQRQLKLARAEGLPTNAAEFASIIQPAPPAENAAPFYRKLHNRKKSKADPYSVELQLLFHPGPSSFADAEDLLESERTSVELTDQAVALPKCWFDRDWSLGAAVLMLEFSDMKFAAKLLSLRGSLAAMKGDVAGALADARRMLRLAEHAGCEPTAISQAVKESTYRLELNTLAYWAITHPGVAAYKQEFNKVLKDLPKPNLELENRDCLYILLLLVDESTTRVGRKALGVKEEDVPQSEKFMPLILDRGEAKAKIVRAQRAYWAALKTPGGPDANIVVRSQEKVADALYAFPTAAGIVSMLSPSPLSRETNWEARRLQYTALFRAIQSKGIPNSIRTADLLSPFDDKPLAYLHKGGQIIITVSGYEDENGVPIELKVPPDKAFKSPSP